MERNCRCLIRLIVFSVIFNLSLAYAQDTTHPTVSIQVPSGVQNAAFDVTITFSEPVTKFEQTDLKISSKYCTVTTWTAQSGGEVYIAEITPSAKIVSPVKVQVPANVAVDGADNGNLASREASISIDTRIPITILYVSQDVIIGRSFQVKVDFGEPMYGFTRDELVLSSPLNSRITSWSGSNGSSVFTATITVEVTNGNSVGGVLFSVAARVAEDRAGNPNTAVKRGVVIYLDDSHDNIHPSTNLIVPTDEQKGAFEVAVEFSEPVTGFSTSDINLSWFPSESFDPNNQPTSRLTIVDWTAYPGGQRYTFTVRSSSTDNGQVDILIPKDAAFDKARNGNYATKKSVTVNPPAGGDTTDPTVSITVPSGEQDEVFDVTVVFNEIVPGFKQSELRISGSARASITAWNPQSNGKEYKATITPTRDGSVTLNISRNVAQDQAGNGNVAATAATVAVNLSGGSGINVTLTVLSSIQRAPFNVTVRFSQSVTGFVQSDLSFTGVRASITNWNPNSSGSSYSATITPTQAGDMVFMVAAGVTTEGNAPVTSRTVVIWPEDVDRNGYVESVDLLYIASRFGQVPEGISRYYDVDRDGDIDTTDFRRVVSQLGGTVNSAGAPSITSQTPHEWLQRIKALETTDPVLQLAIQLLEEQLIENELMAPVPKETVLLSNYPNPFNPETWIPYRLANAADVTVTIYAANGSVVRNLTLGHQQAGNYLDRTQAAYWDGRNASGEPVASGLYFYTLTADGFSDTRKMFIAK